MANISSQTTRTSGRAQNYAKKDAVAISAVGASVQRFEQRLAEIRRAHGKDGLRPRAEVNEEGKPLRDDKGDYVVAKDSKGNTVYEAKYVEAYSLVQSFGHDELDPDDPDSWMRANELGRAIAEDRFPGHPALIATEINGRSGCVHNHLIVGAIHADSGRSIDSNLVTHARLAIEHDRVLAQHGFVQREDMRSLVADAKRRMDEAREAIIAEHGGKISESQMQRKRTAAENRVTLTNGEDRSLQQAERPSAHQVREDRRQREFHRYELREQECEAALGIGATPPPERFSEIVLESRIRETLRDPRVQSWADAAEIGRENGVTIKRRGRDVSYGMMLALPDGTIADPARAHTRRGKSLGEGFRVADVDEAIEQNVRLQKVADRRREEAAIEESLKARIARGDAAMQPMLEAEARARLARMQQGPALDAPASPAPAATAPVPSAGDGPGPDPEPKDRGPIAARTAFTSPLHQVVEDSTRMSDHKRTQLECLAALDEDYLDRETDAEFEQRLTDAGGVGPQTLRSHGEHFSDGMLTVLRTRQVQIEDKDRAWQRTKELKAEVSDLESREGLTAQESDRLDAARAEAGFERRYHRAVETDIAEGRYELRDHDRERGDWARERLSDQVAALDHEDPEQPTAGRAPEKALTHAQQRVREIKARQKDADKTRKERSQDQSHDMGM